jgi:uncharacterized membrane protein HdeD (DUF308 family)
LGDQLGVIRATRGRAGRAEEAETALARSEGAAGCKIPTMASSRRILWITLGVLALLDFAIDILGSSVESDLGVICLISGIVGFGSARATREHWRALPRRDQSLLLIAWYALFVAAVVYDNRKMPSTADIDITLCTAIPIVGTALFFLYRAFSKSMDILWMRFTRR